MFYRNELNFLRNVFDKRHIQTFVVSPDDSVSRILGKSFDGVFSEDLKMRSFLEEVKQKTIYKLKDNFKLSYVYFLLPDMEEESLFFLGPYVNTSFSADEMLEVGEKNGIHPKNQKAFERYLQSVPVIDEGSSLFTMLNAFGEKIWDSSSFSVVDIDKEDHLPFSPINDKFDDIFVDMETMEKRYSYENEIMEAVASGQIYKEGQFLSNFSDDVFEKRIADPLRNMKNYCIIMNTLLRKAAERGGVHPIYLDRVSSDFAAQIEKHSTPAQVKDLMRDMFRSYCRLVRKHSIKNYSPIVQKVIIMIDSDISADLSLRVLAASQKVSPGYLSTIFKKENGKSVTEYIREKRIKHAKHLLATTNLQIQTIALHCGIMDVQYFTKIFKGAMGISPSEYREIIRK